MRDNCEGCGTALVDGGVDWYCPNKVCSFEMERARALVRDLTEQRERAEYERLKAKYG